MDRRGSPAQPCSNGSKTTCAPASTSSTFRRRSQISRRRRADRLCKIGKAVTFVSYRRGNPREPWSFYIAKADSERRPVELLAIFPNIFDTIVREHGLQRRPNGGSP